MDKKATEVFEEVKKRMIEAYVLHLPDFSMLFEVSCDQLHDGIEGILSQESHPIAYFSENMNEAETFAKHIPELHDEIRRKITLSNEGYKVHTV